MNNRNTAERQTIAAGEEIRPRLVKASEFAARRDAAELARREREVARPTRSLNPRGEVEARAIFDSLFEAA